MFLGEESKQMLQQERSLQIGEFIYFKLQDCCWFLKVSGSRKEEARNLGGFSSKAQMHVSCEFKV
jgi:hypothetical protein